MISLSHLPKCPANAKLVYCQTTLHTSCFAGMEGDKILFHFEEERYNRVKNGLYALENWIAYPEGSRKYILRTLGNIFAEADFLVTYEMSDDYVNALGVSMDKVVMIPHHLAHAASAYYPSGFKEPTLILAIDGWGADVDEVRTAYSAGFYLGENATIREIGNIPATRVSLGFFYTFITELLGWKRTKDEGKVVGMAPHGEFDQSLYDAFRKIIKLDGITTRYIGGDTRGMVQEIYNAVIRIFGDVSWRGKKSSQFIARNAQQAFEDTIVELVTHLHNLYPHVRKLAVAGGIFANVALNKRLNELDFFDEMFVAPQMGDEGLSIGSMLAFRGLSGVQQVFTYDDVYLGSEPTENDVQAVLSNMELDWLKFSPEVLCRVTANLLTNGNIVGLFQGKSESGPRALGNRSILADPRQKWVVDRLSKTLRRNEFMPFSPTVLKERANDIFVFDKSTYAGEFMTMAYDTRPEWVDRIPAVLHPVDHTARIQALRRETNPIFYDIIKFFDEETSVPLVLNTSFNVHDEPIIDNVHQAVTHLKNGVVDYLVFPPYILFKK